MRSALPGVLVLALACGGGGDAPEPEAAAPPARAVSFQSPADGAEVGPSVLVRLGVSGVTLMPADGLRKEGEGHHHVFVDVDPSPADSVIGRPPGVYHIGTGADTLRLEGLAPGTHRLIAVFAWGDHVPMTGVVPDTITVVVR